MSKIIKPRFDYENLGNLMYNEVEDSYTISPNQLKNAKIFSKREYYIETLPYNLKYLEVGVAWGYYSLLVAKEKNPSVIHLQDLYNQEHVCWGEKYNGVCSCSQPHGNYTSETHEEYIIDLFSEYNAKTFKGDSRDVLPKISYKYDYIYIDSNNDRDCVTPTLWAASKLVNEGAIIGLNDYLMWDGIIEERAYGVSQAVNEFLDKNQDWEVDAIALHPLGFYDIYIRMCIMN